jgi:hypothetical protein
MRLHCPSLTSLWQSYAWTSQSLAGTEQNNQSTKNHEDTAQAKENKKQIT